MSGTLDTGTIDVMNGPQFMGEVFVVQGLFDASAVTVEGGARGYPSGDPFGSGGTLVVDGTLLSDGTFDIVGAAAMTAGRNAPGTGALVSNAGSLVNAGSLDIEGGDGAFRSSPGGSGGTLENHGDLDNIGSILIASGGSGTLGAAGGSGQLANDAVLVNAGSIEIEGGQGDSSTGAGGRVGGGPGTLVNSGDLTSTGTLLLDGGGAALSNNSANGTGGHILNTGVLRNDGLLSVSIGGVDPAGGAGGQGGSIENDGTLIDTGTLSFAPGGGPGAPYAFGRAGSLTGTGTLVDTGLVLAGSGSSLADGSLDLTGTLALDGNASFSAVTDDNGTITGAGTLISSSLSLTGVAPATITLGEFDNEGTVEIAGIGVIDAVIGGFGGDLVVEEEALLVLKQPLLTDPSGDVLASQTIVFAGDAGAVSLTAAAAGSFTTFDAAGLADTATSFATLTGETLAVGNGSTTEYFGLAGEPDGSTFSVFDDGHGGTLIERDTAPCFAAGTRIATPHGEIPVERLSVGGSVLTEAGGERRIAWIGRRRILCDRHPAPHEVRPVRIRADSFGAGRPSRDLLLSPDHALLLDGHLVPAGLLVDGERITQEPVTQITYLHVELDAHDILLAENLPAESYLDTGNRSRFSNAPITALHPNFVAHPEAATPCAPMLLEGPRLDAIRTRLARPAALTPPIGTEPRRLLG